MSEQSARVPESTVQEKAAQLKRFSFFKECPSDFFLALALITETRSVPPNFEIIKQGDLNDSLFFLLTGRVDVLVTGERVAVLEKAGDLLGEMSVITSRPASATIISLEPVSFYAINASKLDELIHASRRDFGYHLYRTYSTVLSEKILATNDKARRFEMANRALIAAIQALEEANRNLDSKVKERTQALEAKTSELERSYAHLETQNTELLASHRKLEELYSSKEITFKNLNELSKGHLEPLAQTLADLFESASPADRHRIERAQAQVESSLAKLRPLTTLYSTEQAVRSRRVLLAESDRKQQVVAKLALGGTGVGLDIASTELEILDKIESGAKFDLVFLSPDMAGVGARIQARLPSAKLVFMASTDIPSYLPVLRKHSIFSNIVSRDESDRTFTVKNIMTTVTKLLSQDLFGLEKYLIWGVDVHSRPVEGSAQRAALIEEMQERFSQLGVRSRISERAATVAEELLMNAIYDAPLSPEGQPLYNALPRTQEVQLNPKEKAEFRFACDGMLAAVSVSDPFGGFKSSILFDYLERNYSGAQETQSEGKSGAGRGLHQIIENSDLVVFNVKRKMRTEVIALFNLDPQSRTTESKPSFHFFAD